METKNNRLEYDKLIKEYFTTSGWTRERLSDYRKRLKDFFDNEQNHADYYEDFLDSGVGESFYVAHGEQIIRDYKP